jgi:hypothetical protein
MEQNQKLSLKEDSMKKSIKIAFTRQELDDEDIHDKVKFFINF